MSDPFAGERLSYCRRVVDLNGQIAALVAERDRLRAAWKIAEPFLPSPVYQRALAALQGHTK